MVCRKSDNQEFSRNIKFSFRNLTTLEFLPKKARNNFQRFIKSRKFVPGNNSKKLSNCQKKIYLKICNKKVNKKNFFSIFCAKKTFFF